MARMFREMGNFGIEFQADGFRAQNITIEGAYEEDCEEFTVFSPDGKALAHAESSYGMLLSGFEALFENALKKGVAQDVIEKLNSQVQEYFSDDDDFGD